jgi:hypothetical protein
MVHCLEELRSLEFEVWMKHGEHEDLHGSGRQSIISYVCGRCVGIAVCSLNRAWFASVAVRPLYSTGADRFMQPQGLIGGPRVVMSCYIN